MDEILYWLVEIEKQATQSEQRLFSTEEELKNMVSLIEENKKLHEINNQL